MAERMVDLTLTLTDNMPAHELFQRPVIVPHYTHEQTREQFFLGVEDDRLSFATTYMGMIDHVGTHVDAFYHVNPEGAPVDQMPLDMFMGKAVCWDLTHIPDLGAGKTTLVNRLLSAPDAGRIAVIVNEFGEIGTDGDLIARASEDMLELTNGCICRAAQGDLMDGLNRLFLRKVGLAEPRVDFDKIVIETTGIADPSPLARLFYTDMKLDLTFRLDAVLTVVDLKHVTGQLARSPEAEKQIAIADKLIFNKRDLVDDAEFTAAVTAVERLSPFSVKEVTTHGALPVDALLDLDLFEPKRRDDMVGAWIGAGQPAGATHGHDDHVHTPGVGAVCLQTAEPLEWNALLRFFLDLTHEKGEDLFRVEGLIHFQNVEKPVILQGVQATFSPPTYAESWPRGEVATRIVVIGRNLDAAAMQEGFIACVARRETELNRGLGAI